MSKFILVLYQTDTTNTAPAVYATAERSYNNTETLSIVRLMEKYW